MADAEPQHARKYISSVFPPHLPPSSPSPSWQHVLSWLAMLISNPISLFGALLSLYPTIVLASPIDHVPNDSPMREILSNDQVPTPPASIVPPPGEAFIADSDFNAGHYGGNVRQTFKSINITATRLNMQNPFTNCDDGSYLFMTPRGPIVDSPRAAIYDARYGRVELKIQIGADDSLASVAV